MREIKFRAWDNDRKKMLYDINDLFDGFMHWVDQKIDLVDCVEQGTHTEYRRPILLQFTGLTDRFGKEIYEGDIVFNSADKYNYSIDWDEQHACWSLGENGYLIDKCRLYEFWEIIGNIYENSELLEDKNASRYL